MQFVQGSTAECMNSRAETAYQSLQCEETAQVRPIAAQQHEQSRQCTQCSRPRDSAQLVIGSTTYRSARWAAGLQEHCRSHDEYGWERGATDGRSVGAVRTQGSHLISEHRHSHRRSNEAQHAVGKQPWRQCTGGCWFQRAHQLGVNHAGKATSKVFQVAKPCCLHRLAPMWCTTAAGVHARTVV